MKKKKGYVAPVLVVAFLLLYYMGIAVVFALQPGVSGWLKALLCLIPLGVCGVTVLVLVQRIRELNSGETDDLDNY